MGSEMCIRDRNYSVHAEYATEMVRQMLYAQYKEDTYTRGLTVITTLNSADQKAAYDAALKSVGQNHPGIVHA